MSDIVIPSIGKEITSQREDRHWLTDRRHRYRMKHHITRLFDFLDIDIDRQSIKTHKQTMNWSMSMIKQHHRSKKITATEFIDRDVPTDNAADSFDRRTTPVDARSEHRR